MAGSSTPAPAPPPTLGTSTVLGRKEQHVSLGAQVLGVWGGGLR